MRNFFFGAQHSKSYSELKSLNLWPSRNWSTPLFLVKISVVIHLNKTLTKRGFLKTGVVASVRNKGRSTATRPAALWEDQQLFVSAGPGDRQLMPHLSNY